jgi:hypothetical protein
MAVRRSDRRRLARLAAPRVAARLYAVEHRRSLRSTVAMGETIRGLLEALNIEPAGTHAIRYAEGAAAELAAIPDTPELRQADTEYCERRDTGWIGQEWGRGRYRPPIETKTVADELKRLIKLYRERPAIDLAQASMYETYAWCLFRCRIAIEAAADGSPIFVDDAGDAGPGELASGNSAEGNQ